MSYWKCWRNTRLIVFSYLLFLIAVTWDIVRQAPMPLGVMTTGIDGWHNFALLFGGLALAAWILGTTGKSRDIAEEGAIPTPSASSPSDSDVWTESAVVLIEIIALSCITMTAFLILFHFKMIYFGLHPKLAQHHPIGQNFPLSAVLLVTCTLILFSGLLFSVTYLLTILVRSTGAGLLLSAVVFISYIFLQIALRNLSGPLRLNLPSPIFNPFDFNTSGTPLALRLLASVLSRAALIAALLYSAQLAIKRIQIRART